MKSLLAVEKLYRYDTYHKKDKKIAELEVKDGEMWIGKEQIERALSDYLSKLTLLYDVPFAYLVPDESALPEESIRFFELNPMWVKSLLDGALSIGRNTKRDYDHDSSLIHQMYSGAVKNNMGIRKNLSQSERSQAFEEQYQKLDQAINDGTRYTGFLLRSTINTDFQGLEFMAWDQDKELPIARLERLGGDVLLGLFMGVMTCMEIRQPRESIHLGLGDGEVKILRGEDGALDQSRIVSGLPGKVCDPLTGKLNYKKMAEEIQKAVHQNEVTSADLALQLIQNAYSIRFILSK